MTTVSVLVHSEDSDAEEIDRATRQLRQELLALDVEDVRPAQAGEAPPNAKGDPVTVGNLVVELANSAGLAALFQLISTWVTRGQGRSITIKENDRELTIDGGKAHEHRQIIERYLRNATPTSNDDSE